MIRVIGDRVLVLLPPPDGDIVTASGLVLMRDPDLARLPTRGIVLQLGEKSNTCDLDDVRSEIHTWFVERYTLYVDVPVDPAALMRLTGDAVDRILMDMQPSAFDVAVGDCVLFSAGAGEQFRQDGKDYVVLREDEIIGVVQPKSEAA